MSQSPPSDRRRGTSIMLGGAIVAAFAVYAFQLVGARVLGEVEFTPIANLWTLQFLVVTVVLFPVEQLTIRRIAVRPDHPIRSDLPMVAGVVGATALISGVLLFSYRDELLDGEATHAIQGVLLVLGYGVFAFGKGRLAGNMDYRQYGFATGAEALNRLLLAVAFLALARGSIGVGWAMVLAPLVILAWRPFRPGNDVHARRDTSRVAGFLAGYIVANGASNVILAAGPLVVDLLGATNAEVSEFFFTLILLRAPFTLAYGLVARILAPMARLVSEGRAHELRRLSWLVLGGAAIIASVGGLLGGWVGPDIVRILFGAEPAADVAALIVAGIGAAFGSLLLTQILVAKGHTGRLAVSWSIALVAASGAVLFGSAAADTRVAIAFLVGQATALVAVTVASLGRSDPTIDTPREPTSDAADRDDRDDL